MSDQRITKRQGIAGQVQYDVAMNEERTLSFVGSVYGGPVVMIGESGAQVFVTDPGRFGEFGREWVERFIAEGRDGA